MDLEPHKKTRKSSIQKDEFETALTRCYQALLMALNVLPKEGWVLCFTGSILVRAMNPNPYSELCRDFLYWRYSEHSRITNDCDIIFEEDPSEDLQRKIRNYNRNPERKSLFIDWWRRIHYKSEEWALVKDQSLNRSNIISKIPIQPLDILIHAKKNLLKEPKHVEDAENLPIL